MLLKKGIPPGKERDKTSGESMEGVDAGVS